MNKPRFLWDVAVVLLGSSLIAAIGVPVYALMVGVEPWLWPIFAVLMIWNGLSITAGYHRLWSHKSYEAHPAVRTILALGGALALQNSIREWCSNHRNHHRYTDDPEFDPYSAKRGLYFSHIGWMLRDYSSTSRDYKNIRDLERDPVVTWQHRYYWPLVAALNLGLPLGAGWMVGDTLGGLMILGFLRLALCHHSTFFINSLAHFWGRQPYSDGNTSRDNGVLAVLTYGEGYHNFHHKFQWDYRNGIRWYQFDPTKWLIRVLDWIGLATGLKRATPEQIETAIVAMQLKRITERINRFKPNNMDQWLSLLDAEYDKLVTTLNAWSECRREWLTVKRTSMLAQWEKTEFLQRLSEIEQQLDQQRRQWRLLNQQFA